MLVLTLLFCIGIGVALSNMSRLSTNLIQAQAVQDVSQHAQALSQAINLYSDTAVDRAKPVNGITVTHDYLTHPGGIPLPSTFAIELGDRISEQDSEMKVRLYSDYPFPWRRAKGGVRDKFEQEALTALRRNSRQPYYQFEQQGKNITLRYGEASIMKPTCVTCHNTHPNSPKKDWEVGDVGGVWEISESLDNFDNKVQSSLRGTFVMLGSLSVLGLSGLSLVVGKLRQTARELEGRVQKRTADLAQVNLDLEKRNHLIRQVFGRYLSDEVVTNLLEAPEGLKLGGERREITILTSDLRGFTSFSERLPPEEVIHVLNLYLEQMADVINQYQGTIDEFMGDGILVLFGAPTPRPDDAIRAVACACAMQLAMGAVQERLRQRGLPLLEMGIGIHTGEVVVGNIGSEKRTKYGIVGSPVNLTYRIEAYTRGGQIFISEEAWQAAGSSVRISSKKQVQPKGVNQPITIYEVYGVSGLYNIYLPQEQEVPLALPKPIPLQYAMITDKQINQTIQRGKLVKLSSRGGTIQAEQLPDELTNLKLNFLLSTEPLKFSEDIYAKVAVSESAQGYFTIHFTAVPPALQAQLDQLYKALRAE